MTHDPSALTAEAAVSQESIPAEVATDAVETQPNIDITPSAREYLRGLLDKQDSPDIAVRIFVEQAGTPRAECCMAYCAPGEEQPDDYLLTLSEFNAYLDQASLPYLKDAVVDYNKDRFGGQLTFKAPNSKVPRLGANASLEERINYILQSEINPNLAAHGGHVSLLEIDRSTDGETIAVLQFGGGCQGCSAVDLTLREGVEVQLKAQVPELTRVVDSTDHSKKETAYM